MTRDLLNKILCISTPTSKHDWKIVNVAHSLGTAINLSKIECDISVDTCFYWYEDQHITKLTRPDEFLLPVKYLYVIEFSAGILITNHLTHPRNLVNVLNCKEYKEVTAGINALKAHQSNSR